MEREPNIEKWLKGFKPKPVDPKVRQRIMDSVAEASTERTLPSRLRRMFRGLGNVVCSPKMIILGSRVYKKSYVCVISSLLIIICAHFVLSTIASNRLQDVMSVMGVDSLPDVSLGVVADADNAAIPLAKAQHLASRHQGDSRWAVICDHLDNWSEMPLPVREDLKQWIRTPDIAKVNDLFKEASKRKAFRYSQKEEIDVEEIGTIILDADIINRIAMASIFAMNMEGNEGRIDDSIRSVTANMRMARMFGTSGDLTFAKVGIILQGQSLDYCDLLLQTSRLDKELFGIIEEELRDHSWAESTKTALRNEKIRFISNIQSGDVTTASTTMPERTKSLFEKIPQAIYRYKPFLKLKIASVQKELEQKYANNVFVRKSEQFLDELAEKRLPPAVSEKILKLYSPEMSKKSYLLQSRTECVRIALAHKRYYNKYRKGPKKLENLVPEFLPEIPKDPLNGKDYIFLETQDSFSVYSEGIEGDTVLDEKTAVVWKK